MTNLGGDVGFGMQPRQQLGAGAPLIKKCAILAISPAVDQCYAENYDECCAMLRVVTKYVWFLRSHQHAICTGESEHCRVFLQFKPRFQEW
ncbi:hypothetical protein AUC60_26065 [Pseudomonas caspiana]|uniref:Uncharacterized protein n=1 Tax=Pseudomonas caspiana TaxID=1451454 RepID=A0A1Y3P2C8_9PSED|nr:hypothetical protein AUC60_26065 [Pseudomonas caspiana]